MIINPTSSLRETEANQSPDEKRLKSGAQPTPAPITARSMPDEDASPQAQLVQHMIDAWQSKEGTVSGKVLTELDTPESDEPVESSGTSGSASDAKSPDPTKGGGKSDQAVLVDMMQTLGGNAQRVTSSDGQPAVQASEQGASRLDGFRDSMRQVSPLEGAGRENSPSVVMDFLSPQAAQATVATRDIVSPQSQQPLAASPPPPVVDKSPIPVHIPELDGVVSDTCFEFAAMPPLVEGRFEALAA